jgi:hypothetical protein
MLLCWHNGARVFADGLSRQSGFTGSPSAHATRLRFKFAAEWLATAGRQA